MKRQVLIYGLIGGLLITVLKWTEYRFLVIEHSIEIYGALVAALFAGLGIWLGQTLTRKKPAVILKEVPTAAAGRADRQDRPADPVRRLPARRRPTRKGDFSRSHAKSPKRVTTTFKSPATLRAREIR